jgi:hypothetical protein
VRQRAKERSAATPQELLEGGKTLAEAVAALEIIQHQVATKCHTLEKHSDEKSRELAYRLRIIAHHIYNGQKKLARLDEIEERTE